MAGPTTRAVLAITEFSVTALRRCSGPTISSMNDWRAGFSKALLRPSRAASTPICQYWTSPVIVSTPRISAWRPIRDCSESITRRLLTRSAITPPYGPSRRTGRVWSPMMTPSAVLECVRVRTSHAWAVICIQVPASDVA